MNKSYYIGLIAGLCLTAPGVQAQQSASAHVPAVSRKQPEAEKVLTDSLSTQENRSGASDSLLLLSSGVLSADTLVGVSNVRVSCSKGDLFVAMDLDVSRLKVRNDNEYHYVPRIKYAGRDVALPAVVLASRNLYYRHLRNQDLPADAQLYDSRGLLSVSYRVTVPFEPWMRTAVLQVGPEVYPLDSLMGGEPTELHALSLASGLAAAMALSPEQQENLSKELKSLTLTPEMQELLAAALQTIAETPAASQAPATLEPEQPMPQDAVSAESPATLKPDAPAERPTPELAQAPESPATLKPDAPAERPTPELAQAPESQATLKPDAPAERPTPELAQASESQATLKPEPTIAETPAAPQAPATVPTPAERQTPELAQAIGLLGLPGEVQVRLVTEIQALPMSPELRTVLVTALQTLAKAETFVPVFVYRTPPAEESKLRAEKGTANIEFRLNETAIDPSLRGNRTELDKIKRTLEALENDTDYTLKRMTVKGYASPEGPYAGNAALAAARMEAVKTYVRGLTDFPSGRITADYEAEDWDGLKMVLEASDLPHKAAILKIMADTRLTPDAREWKIKSQYKDDYAYMRAYIYPALRHVDYVVEYEVRAYADPAEIVRLLETQPQKLSLQEMYRAARTMAEGSEAYDEVFETAVRLFPSDETANLNAANSAMRWRDLNRAERYLAKAGQSPEAIYARGNCAALRGDYEAAAGYFKQAADKGVAEATAAMERLRTLQANAASEQEDGTIGQGGPALKKANRH